MLMRFSLRIDSSDTKVSSDVEGRMVVDAATTYPAESEVTTLGSWPSRLLHNVRDATNV
jgi:hypothetical protein